MMYLPIEIVRLIADYHDYDKYCKPMHKKNIQSVLMEIRDIGNIMQPVCPSIVYKCWNETGWRKYEQNNMLGVYEYDLN